MANAVLARFLIITAALATAACVTPRYEIQQPVAGTPVECTDPAGQNCDVTVVVQWQGVAVHPVPDLFLDQVAKPNVLAPVGNVVRGVLKAPVGGHEVTVSGALSGQGGVRNYSATTLFRIDPAPGRFALSTPPADVVIERSASGAALINVNRSAPFAGAVSLALTSPPAGVSSGGATIAAGSPSASLPIAVALSAAPGKHPLTVTGSGGGNLSDTVRVNLLVGRTTGAFAEANPTPYSSAVPSSSNSQAGGFRVDVALGGPSLPTGWRAATFFKAGQRIGQPVGYTIGPANNLAGAGFCANGSPTALTRGVVMSGQQASYATQNVITIIDLVGNGGTHSIPVDQTRMLNGQFYSFQPRVLFSPDCTIALLASINPIGPSPNIIRVLDVQTGRYLGSEMPFYSNAFRAAVVTMGARQVVNVEVDFGTPQAQNYSLNIQ